MSVVLHVFTWFLGIFVSVQVVASFYSVVDFHQQLRRYRWTVIGRIAASLLGLAAVYWLLPSAYEETLVDGVQFHVGIHLLLMFLPNLMLVQARFVAEKRYRQFLRELAPRRP